MATLSNSAKSLLSSLQNGDELIVLRGVTGSAHYRNRDVTESFMQLLRAKLIGIKKQDLNVLWYWYGAV